jgi:DNA-binding response OmpR family regulator
LYRDTTVPAYKPGVIMKEQPRILYVDDEKDLLSLAQSFFEDEKLAIDTCSCFNEALYKVRTYSYDLIISDARLPAGSGKELLRRLREEKFQGKFIMVTGNLEHEDEGRDDYDLILFKPLHFQELVNQAKRILLL